MYCVESAVAQNFRSASSFLNSGILFMAFPDLRFIPVHISGADNPDQLPPDRECNKQSAARGCVSQRVVSFLSLRVANIAADDQWLAKKDIFGLLRTYAVPGPIFVGIGIVPVKPDAMLQRVQW